MTIVSMREARLEAALEKIARHWGDPAPLGTPHKELMRMWMGNYHELQEIANLALGYRPKFGEKKPTKEPQP